VSETLDQHGYDVDDPFGFSLTDDEIKAGAGKLSKFSAREIRLAGARIDAAGVVPEIEKWRAEDRQFVRPDGTVKGRGGRKPLLTDRSILIASLLLMMEGSPLWVTEMRNLFWYRLEDDARIELGVASLKDSGDDKRDSEAWYFRVHRRLHGIIDTFDGWPAPRILLGREERVQVLSLRDKNMTRLKLERNRWFTSAMLEMTIQSQPRHIRRAWKGAISGDQSSIKAPSQLRPWKKKDGVEIPRYNATTREEIQRPVLEIDAGLYPVDKGAEIKDFDVATEVPKSETKRTPKELAEARAKAKANSNFHAWELSYMANILIQVRDKPDDNHPQLIIGASLGVPNKEVGEHTVAIIDSILDHGHKISRFTADRGYSGNVAKEDLHIQLKQRRIPFVMDYNTRQKGVQGQTHGALQVEGAHYCPATPMDLLDATVQMDEQIIDQPTYKARIEERRAYRVKPKEKPDEDGHYPVVCPAYGPGATIECPILRGKPHPKASKKAKPTTLRENIPLMPDKICTQSSVTFTAFDGVEYEQPGHYGDDEWHERYKHDRNSIESMNDYLKSGPEAMKDSSRRQLRGLAAQSYILTMMYVSANLRKIARFLRDAQRKPKPTPIQRKRDRKGLSNYARWRYKVASVLAHELDPPLKT